MRRGLFIIVAALLGGCAANPSVRYGVAASGGAAAPPSSIVDAFYLQRNVVTLELKDTATAGRPPAFGLVVSDVRVEDQGLRLLLLRGDSPWTRTTVNLTKVENTDLVATAGVEVVDRRSELLQTAATVVKAVAPIVMGVAAGPASTANLGPGCADFPIHPCRLDPVADLSMGLGGDSRTSGPLRVAWGAIPASAITTGNFAASIAGRQVHGLYYAACRTLRFTFLGSGQTYSWSGKVADPRYVEYVAFPRKGSVRMHEQCGASVTTEKDPTQSMDQVVSTAVAQAVAIRDAIQKASEDKAKEDAAH